jgi:hypothetical protein
MKAKLIGLLAAVAAGLGGAAHPQAQETSGREIVIRAPAVSGSTQIGVADSGYVVRVFGWTCLDTDGTVQQAIDAAATEVLAGVDRQFPLRDIRANPALVADAVNGLVDFGQSTDDEQAVPSNVAANIPPGGSDTTTIRNCFRTATQADIDSLKKSLGDRIILSVISQAARQ